MLVLERDGSMEDSIFSSLPDKLDYPLCIVRNITRVQKTRLFARRKSGALIEILILDPYNRGMHEALIHKGGRLKEGETLNVENARIRIISRNENVFTISIDCDIDEYEFLERMGHVPLPPYIKRPDIKQDETDYQTVFARIPGSSAAPTAGLHFSETIIGALKERGAVFCDVLLHVGLGTFEPVKTDDIEGHRMHSEYFELSRESSDILNNAREQGMPVMAVGTTALRVLETVYDIESGKYRTMKGNTDIFIRPPMKVHSADILLTNFHLPKSTLLMLVSSFAGYEKIMNAYTHAVRENYRFFSYGDCMLIR